MACSGLFRADLIRGQICWYPARDCRVFDAAARKGFSKVVEWTVSQKSPALLFHGSAVDFGKGAVCFLGASGKGKSTMGAAFLARGFRLLNDDTAVIRKDGRKLVLQPGFANARIRPPTARWLERTGASLRASPSESKPAALKSIYLLSRRRRCRSIRFESLKGRDLLISLTQQTLCPIVQSLEVFRKNFQLTIDVLREVPVKRPVYPTGFRRLHRVCDAVLRDMRG